MTRHGVHHFPFAMFLLAAIALRSEATAKSVLEVEMPGINMIA
jgi:hypothetical protein